MVLGSLFVLLMIRFPFQVRAGIVNWSECQKRLTVYTSNQWWQRCPWDWRPMQRWKCSFMQWCACYIRCDLVWCVVWFGVMWCGRTVRMSLPVVRKRLCELDQNKTSVVLCVDLCVVFCVVLCILSSWFVSGLWNCVCKALFVFITVLMVICGFVYLKKQRQASC